MLNVGTAHHTYYRANHCTHEKTGFSNLEVPLSRLNLRPEITQKRYVDFLVQRLDKSGILNMAHKLRLAKS